MDSMATIPSTRRIHHAAKRPYRLFRTTRFTILQQYVDVRSMATYKFEKAYRIEISGKWRHTPLFPPVHVTEILQMDCDNLVSKSREGLGKEDGLGLCTGNRADRPVDFGKAFPWQQVHRIIDHLETWGIYSVEQPHHLVARVYGVLSGHRLHPHNRTMVFGCPHKPFDRSAQPVEVPFGGRLGMEGAVCVGRACLGTYDQATEIGRIPEMFLESLQRGVQQSIVRMYRIDIAAEYANRNIPLGQGGADIRRIRLTHGPKLGWGIDQGLVQRQLYGHWGESRECLGQGVDCHTTEIVRTKSELHHPTSIIGANRNCKGASCYGLLYA